MRKDDYVRFQHMLEAAKEAVAFAKDRQRADLEQDRMLTLRLSKMSKSSVKRRLRCQARLASRSTRYHGMRWLGCAIG